MNTHLMLDLETMGHGPTAAIVAIGAVQFGLTEESAEWLGPSFYRAVKLDSAVQSGGTMDASTVLWWLRQRDEARAALLDPQAITLDEALCEFRYWVADLSSSSAQPRTCMWGNGAAFDNVILRGAFERHGMAPPWSHWDDRCFRTMKREHPQIGPPQRQGVHHNALDDAMHQARHLCAIWRARSAYPARSASEEAQP